MNSIVYAATRKSTYSVQRNERSIVFARIEKYFDPRCRSTEALVCEEVPLLLTFHEATNVSRSSYDLINAEHATDTLRRQFAC